MKPFEKGYIPEAEVQLAINDMLAKWQRGDPDLRELIPAADINAAQACIVSTMRDEMNCEVWMNDKYQVSKRAADDNGIIHLSIKRRDRQPIHDWRDLQKIKNALVGPEHEAVELYPAESRLVDSANQYHLWVSADPKFRFPCGFSSRVVSMLPIGKSVNRKL